MAMTANLHLNKHVSQPPPPSRSHTSNELSALSSSQDTRRSREQGLQAAKAPNPSHVQPPVAFSAEEDRLMRLLLRFSREGRDVVETGSPVAAEQDKCTALHVGSVGCMPV